MKNHLFYAVLLSAAMLTISAAEKKETHQRPYTDEELSRLADTSVFLRQQRFVIDEERYLAVSKLRSNVSKALKEYYKNQNDKTLAALRKTVKEAMEAYLKLEVKRAERNLKKTKHDLEQKDEYTEEVMRALMKKLKNREYVAGSAGK